jgi:hypothetical protein
MGQLKRNKKAGISGTSNEMFSKAKNTRLENYLVILFEMIINEKCVPSEMSMGLLITITKNATESNKDLNNTRPITVSEVISNLFENLIKNEFHKKVNYHPCQYGFRKSSSCSHALFTFNKMVENAKKNKDKLFVFYLDYSKAFDRVNRIKLMYKLIKVLPAHYWLAMMNYYRSTQIRIQGKSGELSEPIKTSIGTKQGGPFSPDAFDYYKDDLLILLDESNLIYKVKNIPMGLIVYADDTTIAFASKKNANRALNLVENYCDAHDILINESKTKWMCFNTNSKGPFYLNNQHLERVKTFKLLGYLVEENMSYKSHVKKRKSLCCMGIKEIAQLGFNDENTPIKMKGLLYNSIGRSKLTYGLENINLNPTALLKLKTFEGNILKRANGLSTRSKTTALRYAMGLTPLMAHIIKRKLSFFIQLSDNSLTRRILDETKCFTLLRTISYVGYEYENTSGIMNVTIVRQLCKEDLEKIEEIETELRNHNITRCVQFLLKNRNSDNDDTLQFILDPRRIWDEN